MPTETANVKVITKERPLLSAEPSDTKPIIKTKGNKTTLYYAGNEHIFSLDGAYGPTFNNKQLYEAKVESYVKRALDGYNVSILTFGTTGSGKSFTLHGSNSDPGIVSQVIDHLFKYIGDKKDRELFITVSFVDIKDEVMVDLLNPHNREMHTRHHPYKSIYVDGLSEIVVKNSNDTMMLFQQGVRARDISSTDISATRLRSSSIFTIMVEQKEKKTSKFSLRATIQLVDLAGIEDTTAAKSSGITTLLDVLACLGDPKSKGLTAPYRDSHLTSLLQNSFGGNSHTLVIATLSPLEKDSEGTFKTLKYCQFAQRIKNTVTANIDETSDIICELRNEISQFRNTITSTKDIAENDVIKLQELVKDLDICKRHTWCEREQESAKILEERKMNLTNKGMYDWVTSTNDSSTQAIHERVVLLQKEKDQLIAQYKETHNTVDTLRQTLQTQITDYTKFKESGKMNENDNKKKITAIHTVKENLKRETETLKTQKQQLKYVQEQLNNELDGSKAKAANLKGNGKMRQQIEEEELKEMEQRNTSLLCEEVSKMKADIENQHADIQLQVAEGRQYSSQEGAQFECDLMKMKSETAVVTLQLEMLREEKQQVIENLKTAYRVHNEEIELQQLQHFQTFREYREMFEQQKHTIESRYKVLLQDCIQDSVYLSSRNNELTYENQSLQQKIAEMKDEIVKLQSTKA